MFIFRRALFQWEQDELNTLNQSIRAGPLLNLNLHASDKAVWLGTKPGQSFVSTLYKQTDLQHGESKSTTRLVWIKYFPPKVQFFGWLAWKHKVKTSIFLHRIGVLNASAKTACIFWKEAQETVEHLFIFCPMV